MREHDRNAAREEGSARQPRFFLVLAALMLVIVTVAVPGPVKSASQWSSIASSLKFRGA